MSRGRESVRAAIAEALGTEHGEATSPREDRRPQWLKDADTAGKAFYDEETGRRVGRWGRVEHNPYRATSLEPLPQGPHRAPPARGLRKPPKS